MKLEKGIGEKYFGELCMNMLPPVNAKAFNTKSKTTDAYVIISKFSMTEAIEDLKVH